MVTRRTSTKTSARRKPTAPKTPAARATSKTVPAQTKQSASYVHDPSLGRLHIIDLPWEMRAAAGPLGAKWNNDLRAFTHVGKSVPSVLAPYASQDHSWERWQEDEVNGISLPVSTSSHPMKPRPHQMEAAKKIAWARKQGFRGFIEADDVGVGKTLACLVGAYGAAKIDGFSPEKKARLLIVCPNSAIPHWRDTLAASGVSHMFRTVVINYERLKKLLDAPASALSAKRTRTKNKQTASKGTPVVDWDIIIADESHKLKNGIAAQQAQAFDRIARYAESAKSAPFVIWASATAAQNPVEAVYLAPLVAQITKDRRSTIKDWGQYLIDNDYHVKEGKAGAVYWVKLDAKMSPTQKASVMRERKQDLTKLRNLLFGPNAPSIRRLPQDIAGWPPIQRIPLPASLSIKDRLLYEQAWTEFRQELKLDAASKNPKGPLAIQTRFRQKISILKAPHTVQNILDLLENGLQVVVSMQFMEAIDLMKEALLAKGIESAEISGRYTKEDREAQRISFQKGEAKVIFCTVVDAISLHAGQQMADGTLATKTPRATLVHDVRYSGIENAQLGGRAHRSGENANVYYLYFINTVEDKIVHTVVDRLAAIHTLSGDPEALTVELENLLESAAA